MNDSLPPLRLLQVVDTLDVGGAERHTVDLALALAGRGHRVTLGCTSAGPLSLTLEREGIGVRVLLDHTVKRRVSIALARQLRYLTESHGFDLIHTHSYATGAAAVIANSRRAIPLVHTEHSEMSWLKHPDDWLNHRLLQRPARVIAVSESVRRRLVKQGAVPTDRVVLIPNAVPAHYRGSDAILAPLRHAGPVVGVVARLQPEKGIAIFLEAAARVVAVCPEVRFLVVGEGLLRAPLEARRDALGLQGIVHFLGQRRDARAIIGLLDILVVPSVTDAAPLVVLEALMAGTPVIASRVGGIPEQIRHEREGILVPPGQPAALAEAQVRLLCNRSRRQELAEVGKRRARHFCHRLMVERIEAVYREVLARPGPARREATVGVV